MNFYEHESLLLVSLQEKKKRKREWKNVEKKREIKWDSKEVRKKTNGEEPNPIFMLFSIWQVLH